MELPLQWMVFARSQLVRQLREPVRSPQKIHREVGQLLRQSDALLVRHLIAPLYLEEECALDRVGVCLVCDFELLAVAALLLGGGEGHGGHACTVTLPSSSPVHKAARDRRTGVVFIEEFREPRCRIRPSLAFRRWAKTQPNWPFLRLLGAEKRVRKGRIAPSRKRGDLLAVARASRDPLMGSTAALGLSLSTTP